MKTWRHKEARCRGRYQAHYLAAPRARRCAKQDVVHAIFFSFSPSLSLFFVLRVQGVLFHLIKVEVLKKEGAGGGEG